MSEKLSCRNGRGPSQMLRDKLFGKRELEMGTFSSLAIRVRGVTMKK